MNELMDGLAALGTISAVLGAGYYQAALAGWLQIPPSVRVEQVQRLRTGCLAAVGLIAVMRFAFPAALAALGDAIVTGRWAVAMLALTLVVAGLGCCVIGLVRSQRDTF